MDTPSAWYSRYVTPEGKAQILADWDRTKQAYLANPPAGDLGGRGYPDPEMFAPCDRLNQFQGVCTLQSCAGHTTRYGYQISGELWLWLSAEVSRAMYPLLIDLAVHPLIERVSTLYHASGQEILDIRYRGQSELPASLYVIEGTLQRAVLDVYQPDERNYLTSYTV